LRRCGVIGASALVAGLAHYTTETNIDALTTFMSEVNNWRDAAIFKAALRLATNRGATPQARVFAVKHLLRLIRPYDIFPYDLLTEYGDTTTTADGQLQRAWPTPCWAMAARVSPDGGVSIVGSPLPPDYEATTRTTLASLANDPASPEPVRRAARCMPPP
jgi:hypothetical protein